MYVIVYHSYLLCEPLKFCESILKLYILTRNIQSSTSHIGRASAIFAKTTHALQTDCTNSKFCKNYRRKSIVITFRQDAKVKP